MTDEFEEELKRAKALRDSELQRVGEERKEKERISAERAKVLSGKIERQYNFLNQRIRPIIEEANDITLNGRGEIKTGHYSNPEHELSLSLHWEPSAREERLGDEKTHSLGGYTNILATWLDVDLTTLKIWGGGSQGYSLDNPKQISLKVGNWEKEAKAAVAKILSNPLNTLQPQPVSTGGWL